MVKEKDPRIQIYSGEEYSSQEYMGYFSAFNNILLTSYLLVNPLMSGGNKKVTHT